MITPEQVEKALRSWGIGATEDRLLSDAFDRAFYDAGFGMSSEEAIPKLARHIAACLSTDAASAAPLGAGVMNDRVQQLLEDVALKVAPASFPWLVGERLRILITNAWDAARRDGQDATRASIVVWLRRGAVDLAERVLRHEDEMPG